MNSSGVMLSVVIPAFNEERRIGESLKKIMAFLGAQPYRSEIIVADDGSRDGTVALCENTLKNFSHKIIRNTENHGKGFVVRQGMMLGDGEYLLFTDADLSTPIEEVTGFIAALQQGYDVVIGSRDLETSKVEIHQNLLREGMGKAFNLFARAMSFKGIADSQCGFKCFKREVARDLFGRQKLDGFSFDAEILYLAQKRKYRILEAPVVWRNSFQSRVKLLRDPLNMLIDLMRIRWTHRS
jgi:dolichyl-phosphate beta-glucosyltransferase